MKKLLLWLVCLMTAMTADAKSTTTTLWEGSRVNDAEINIAASYFSSAKSGDAIRVTFSFSTAGSMHLCYKTGEGGDWGAKPFNSISQWPYFSDTSVTSAEFSINATDLKTLQTYGMYIYGFESSTITKVELTAEITPSDETDLLDSDWTASWSAKAFAAQTGAKIGDVIKVQYKAFKDDSTDWPWVQFQFMDNSENDLVTKVAASIAKNTISTLEFVITTVEVLDKIQTGGFKIKGDQFVLTSVKLLTYDDSYDAVEVEIREDGIATWSYSKNLDFMGSGITAYYASAVTTGSVKLTATSTTWNYCGYILKGDEGKYTIRVVPDSEASYPAATYLKAQVGEGKVAASTEDTFHYIFAKDKSGNIAFYKLTADHTLGAKKAYLETETDIAPTSENARVAMVFDDGVATEIKTIDIAPRTAENYYDLQGRRVTHPVKGIYVINGKKIVVK